MKRRDLQKFVRDDSGGVLIYTAFASAVMLGFVGLAMDVSFWYAAKRDMQSAADAGAMTAALELARGATTGEIETRTKAAVLLNGYPAGDVTVNNPPQSGAYNLVNGYVEVIVSQPQSGFVSGILHPAEMPVQARAVATLAGAPACVIALNPSDDATLSVQGSARADLNCGAQANSDSPIGLSETGGPSYLHATSVQTTGPSYEGSDYVPDPVTDMAPTADPFSYLVPPTAGPCLEPAGTPKLYPSSYSGPPIPAGNYCGGIQVQGADVIFQPGVYTVGEVGLHLSGNADITGDDVTFYFPDTVVGLPSQDYPDSTAPANRTLFIAGATTTIFNAPTTGTYQGILFYQDPNADPDLIWEITGGSDMSLGGTLYAPSSDIYFAGNQDAVASNIWTSVIGDEVHFVGNSGLAGAGFTGGNLPLALTSPSLVE